MLRTAATFCEERASTIVSRGLSGMGVESTRSSPSTGSVRLAMTPPSGPDVASAGRPAAAVPAPTTRPWSSTNCTNRSVGPSFMGRPSPLVIILDVKSASARNAVSI